MDGLTNNKLELFQVNVPSNGAAGHPGQRRGRGAAIVDRRGINRCG